MAEMAACLDGHVMRIDFAGNFLYGANNSFDTATSVVVPQFETATGFVGSASTKCCITNPVTTVSVILHMVDGAASLEGFFLLRYCNSIINTIFCATDFCLFVLCQPCLQTMAFLSCILLNRKTGDI